MTAADDGIVSRFRSTFGVRGVRAYIGNSDSRHDGKDYAVRPRVMVVDLADDHLAQLHSADTDDDARAVVLAAFARYLNGGQDDARGFSVASLTLDPASVTFH